MGYSVDWVKNNMGITRKALLVYEDKKLIDPVKNPNNNYREYSDEDLERIWGIKMLVELGYSIREIIDIDNSQDFDFYESLEEKIKVLNEKKDRLEQLIGYARAIKVMGRIPTPLKMGSMKFEEFIQYVHETWNVNSDPQIGMLQQMTEKFLKRPEVEWTEEDLNHLMESMGGLEIDTLLTMNDLHNELAKRKNLEVFHPEVQTIVKVLYDYSCKYIFSEYLDVFTPQKFADHIGNSFTDGDIALINEKEYGKDACQFIAKAIKYFGEHATCTDNK